MPDLSKYKFFAVIIHPDQQMSFGGTKDPCGLCSLQSIAKTGGIRNEKYSKMLCEFLNKQLQIPPERQVKSMHGLHHFH
ncbi:unnamed protein product [Ranitomeya imitator]|uniref:Macrophage migration inhibitory factor n=1 Tax=Ranitomeya imitator TaxID=111125 RepID=A0ABN9L0N1_9NEOB|nr:unnamed protein product [Ranitomeya imitator]